MDGDYAQGNQHEKDVDQHIYSEEQTVQQDGVSNESGDGLVKNGNEELQTGRLFVRNLPYAATEDDLAEVFSKFGNIAEVHLVIDKWTKRSKGFAYVRYSTPDAAARAMEELDYITFQGRLLHIMPAKEKDVSENEDHITAGKVKTFKQKREEERKISEAGGNTKAWK